MIQSLLTTDYSLLTTNYCLLTTACPSPNFFKTPLLPDASQQCRPAVVLDTTIRCLETFSKPHASIFAPSLKKLKQNEQT